MHEISRNTPLPTGHSKLKLAYGSSLFTTFGSPGIGINKTSSANQVSGQAHDHCSQGKAKLYTYMPHTYTQHNCLLTGKLSILGNASDHKAHKSAG